jgi:hypothetical protein
VQVAQHPGQPLGAHHQEAHGAHGERRQKQVEQRLQGKGEGVWGEGVLRGE